MAYRIRVCGWLPVTLDYCEALSHVVGPATIREVIVYAESGHSGDGRLDRVAMTCRRRWGLGTIYISWVRLGSPEASAETPRS
jgi:hypothetical protein